VLKIRDGQVANRPVYVAMGITVDGERDVLGLWVGPAGGEGAKQWMSMLTELRNCGVADVCIVCCDGLKGLPDAIAATWPLATVQTCVVHLVRNRLRYASKAHWSKITAGLLEGHPEHPGDHLRPPPQHQLAGPAHTKNLTDPTSDAGH
jgi:putative transposase